MLVTEKISCIHFVEVDGCAFFSNRFYNGLFMVEIATGKTTFLGDFQNERISKRNMHKEIFLKDRNIYFCPRRGRHIHIYNLEDRSIQAIEVRKEAEEPFIVEEVILGEKEIFFLPDQKNFSVRKLNMETLVVTEVIEGKEFHGQYLSKHKDIFPRPELIEDYDIELADRFFGRWGPDEIWYGFLPMGCHLVKYKKDKDSLEIIPLVLMNRKDLKGYLSKVKKELLKREVVTEKEIRFQELLLMMKKKEIQEQNSLGSNCFGETIWRLAKE